MIKKVHVDQLQPGMYVCDFNCGWLGHPFFVTRMMIKNEQQIEKIRTHGIRELYIDTERGIDLPEAPTVEETKEEFTSAMQEMVDAEAEALPPPERLRPTSYREEFQQAKEVRNQARKVISKVLDDIARGKSITTEMVYPVIDNMVESITRNRNTFISLTTVKKRDEYTYLHSINVGALLIAFARFLELPDDQVRQIGIGGIMHDIGKMRVPLHILNKPARLTEPEYQDIKRHVEHGGKLLHELEGLSELTMQVAMQHHERHDGSGYPLGLSGDQISLGGQLASIIDVYDAITSERVYHQGMSPVQAVQKLYEWGKYHFRTDLVQKFISFIGIYPVGTLVQLESRILGVVIESNQLTPIVRIIFDAKSNKFIQPRDIDLSSDMGKFSKIRGYEDPLDWGIDVGTVLSGDHHAHLINN